MERVELCYQRLLHARDECGPQFYIVLEQSSQSPPGKKLSIEALLVQPPKDDALYTLFATIHRKPIQLRCFDPLTLLILLIDRVGFRRHDEVVFV
jgi:hypothetical protein